MVFQEEIGAGSCIEGGGSLGVDRLLRFAIVHPVVLALHSEEDAHKNVGAVGRDGGDGRDVGEEQDAVDARVGYVGKLLEFFTSLVERAEKGGAEVATELVFDTHGNFFEALGAELGHHATGFQGGREFFWGDGEEFFWGDADGPVEGRPAFCAGGVGGGIAAVPPDEEQVGIGWPGRLLKTVEGFEIVEQLGYRGGRLVHGVHRRVGNVAGERQCTLHEYASALTPHGAPPAF